MSRAKWQKAIVSIAVDDGVVGPRRESVSGYVAEGLPWAVTPTHGFARYEYAPWTVTHLRTGLTCAPIYLRTVTDAKRAAEALSALGGWDRTAEEIKADESLRDQVDAVTNALHLLAKAPA